MPGIYAHLTLVNLCRDEHRLASHGLPPEGVACIRAHPALCAIGAVSPDYPYLDRATPGAAAWADEMHFGRSGAMVVRGVERVRRLTGEARRKGLAWLLGYASHMVADMTIHPVVERKVGPYCGNETAHHVCEGHQDAHIYRRTVAAGTGAPGAYLDADVEALWRGLLGEVFAPPGLRPEPDPQGWHRRFWQGRVDKGDGRLLPPSAAAAPDEFIVDLEVPGGRMHYDALFDKAIGHVGEIWRIVADGVLSGGEAFRTHFGNWNLDTGRDQDTGAYVYWG